MIDIISLGAGVQSSTVFLMSCLGILPKAVAAIFADTGWEPKEVYSQVEKLKSIGDAHGLPLHIVQVGDLRHDALTFLQGSEEKRRIGVAGRWASMPLYVLSDGAPGGLLNRQCTKEYKLVGINRKAREIAGIVPRRRYKEPEVRTWIGISSDEASRMRDSQLKWQKNYYPLIEAFEQPMARRDCEQWLLANGFAIPRKSACLGCPFHSDHEWRQIKANPEEWADVTAFDRAIRNFAGTKGKLYLHRSCKPLDELDFSTAEDRGQRNWINECLGLCGV